MATGSLTPQHWQQADRLLASKLEGVLRRGPALRLAMLFGSSVTGQTHSGSDIDIGIVPMDNHLPLQQELALQASLTHVASRKVDLVRLDLASTMARHQVAKNGVPLFEAGPFEVARFKASAVAEYLDFAPALLHAADLFRKRLATGPVRTP